MHDGSILSEQHPRTLTCSRHLVHESRFLMQQSWRALVVSRRRVLRRPPIAGGAVDGHDEQLRASLRARIVGRALPLATGRSWAGKAVGGNDCICCGEIIRRDECEYEPEEHAGLHAHAACYRLWVEESVAMRPVSR